MQLLKKIKYYNKGLWYYYKNFGLSLYILNIYNIVSQVFGGIFKFPKKIHIKIKLLRFKLIQNFLEKEFQGLIKEYKDIDSIQSNNNSKTIWLFRWQGEEYAPELVKLCIKKLRQNKGSFDLVIINKDNIDKYLKFPDFIYKKLKENKITLTHFSDIIRMKLLAEYGGVWVDATMFFNMNIFDKFLNKNIQSSLPPKEYLKNNGTLDKRSGFFIGGKKGNKLFIFAYDFFINYRKKYDMLIDYFLIDHVIHIAYNNMKQCKNDIDEITLKNEDIFELVNKFNTVYEESKYDTIMGIPYYKTTYKKYYHKFLPSGEMTIFGKLMIDNEI